MKHHKLIFILFIMMFFIGCAPSYDELASMRSEKAKVANSDIVVAIVWNDQMHEGHFIKGINLAVEEVNRNSSVLGRRLGRKLRIQMFNTHSKDEEVETARKIARNIDVVAVIGHGTSAGAIAVSIIYERSGVLFISLTATSPGLTGHVFQHIFRNVPSVKQTGHEIARFAQSWGIKTVATIDDGSKYGQKLINSFLEHSDKENIEVKTIRSYSPWEKDYMPLLSDIKSINVDAIIIGGFAKHASEVIKQSRELGLMVPFLSGVGLDQEMICKLPGDAGNGVIVATVYNSEIDNDLNHNFKLNFYNHYKVYPDTFAAQGYDVIKLLAAAFSGAQSTVPAIVSSYMRFTMEHYSIMGDYSFNNQGDVIGRDIYFKQVIDGDFHYIPYPAKNETETVENMKSK